MAEIEEWHCGRCRFLYRGLTLGGDGSLPVGWVWRLVEAGAQLQFRPVCRACVESTAMLPGWDVG